MKNKIFLLSNEVIQQISAGEIIQNPASVVKELLENSLDAGASEIKIKIEKAGKESIHIIDNGEGMNHTDAQKCFQRHSTSKIKKAEDLFQLHSLGFRGEALHSIATVSQVQLITCREDNSLGSCITISGGKIEKCNTVKAQKGTQIRVNHLFYNTPGRLKFLRKDNYEQHKLFYECQKIALLRPDIAFSFSSNRKKITLKPTTLAKRTVDLLGPALEDKLLPCSLVKGKYKIEGYIGTAHHGGGQRHGFLFVNNRCIHSTYLYYAIRRPFVHLLEDGQHPFYLLFLTVPTTELDINIHPMKSEVAFEHEKKVFRYLEEAVEKSLHQCHFSFPKKSSRLSEVQQPSYEKSEPSVKKTSFWEKNIIEIESSSDQLQEDLEEEVRGFSLKDAYIFSEVKSGLLIIDQKAAYERILFETFAERWKKSEGKSKQLLFPIETALTLEHFDLFLTNCHIFRQLGFNFNLEKPPYVKIIAIPLEIKSNYVLSIFTDLLSSCNNCKVKIETIHPWIKQLVKKIATYKVKESMTIKEIKILVRRLSHSPNATPSGKLIWRILSLEKIAEIMT